jgi:hypothetical protein
LRRYNRHKFLSFAERPFREQPMLSFVMPHLLRAAFDERENTLLSGHSYVAILNSCRRAGWLGWSFRGRLPQLFELSRLRSARGQLPVRFVRRGVHWLRRVWHRRMLNLQ